MPNRRHDNLCHFHHTILDISRTIYAINETGAVSNNMVQEAIMKQLINSCILITTGIFMSVSAASAQTQELGGYTVIRSGSASIICLGRWMPPTEVGRPGVCDGQMTDPAQLTAISTRQTAERLDQLLTTLESIDQRLADNNAQIERLIEATVNTQTSINLQADQIGELMHDTITSRIDALSRRVLANEGFKKELEKLKQDILADIKKQNQGKQ